MYIKLGKSLSSSFRLSCFTELRNRVYEYYIINHRFDFPMDIYTYPSLALTRVSKQIRAECRSMCLVGILEMICMRHFDKYLAAYHDGTNFVAADEINVDMANALDKKADDIDMLPLLKRLADRRDVVCTFHHSVHWAFGSAIDYLCTILERCAEHTHDPVWSIAAEKIHSIVPRWRDKRVVVNVKNELKLRGPARRKMFEADLVKDLGLPDGAQWRVLIKYV
jgi:hypothetical protein